MAKFLMILQNKSPLYNFINGVNDCFFEYAADSIVTINKCILSLKHPENKNPCFPGVTLSVLVSSVCYFNFISTSISFPTEVTVA